jgi:HD-GYP domain-containing protein (c-di-GMP phosphodiesterase class II)
MSRYAKTKLINAADLRIGMYVTKLEVPWNETEFPLQGVLVRSSSDIFKLASYGQKLYIDESKFFSQAQANLLNPLLNKTDSLSSKAWIKKNAQRWLSYCGPQYHKNTPLSRALPNAKKILNNIEHTSIKLKYDLRHIDDKTLKEVKIISTDIVSSVINNPDALLWLTKVKNSNRHVFEHSIRASLWAALIGRSIGLRKHLLVRLNLAVLLSGVGKSFLYKFVWKQYRCTEMQSNYALWSDIAVDKLSHSQEVPNKVIEVIANMNERFDGSGLPNRKQADEIPLLSQIASLAETLDLISQPLFSIKKITFSRALTQLYSLADTLFDTTLIEALVNATGLYPVGTHVKLSDGRFGVVIEQSKKRRIRPTIVLTHNRDGERLKRFKIVQLGQRKLKETVIKMEAEKMLDELVNKDFEEIDMLIVNYQNSIFQKVGYFIKNLVN